MVHFLRLSPFYFCFSQHASSGYRGLSDWYVCNRHVNCWRETGLAMQEIENWPPSHIVNTFTLAALQQWIACYRGEWWFNVYLFWSLRPLAFWWWRDGSGASDWSLQAPTWSKSLFAWERLCWNVEQVQIVTPRKHAHSVLHLLSRIYFVKVSSCGLFPLCD